MGEGGAVYEVFRREEEGEAFRHAGSLIAPDAELDMSGEMGEGAEPGVGVTRGQAAIGAFMKAAVEHIVTVHHGHMPEIEITSPTAARGVWAMQDFLKMPEGSPLGMNFISGVPPRLPMI